MNRKFFVLVLVITLIIGVSSAFARGPEGGRGEGRGPAHGKRGMQRGAAFREHLESCSECKGIADELMGLHDKLQALDLEIDEHRWDKSLVRLTALKEEYPDKANKIDELIDLKKKMWRNHKKMHEFRAEERKIAKNLKLAPEDMRAVGGFGGQFGRQMMEHMAEKRHGGPEGGPGKGPRGQRRGEWQERRLERIEESDPELYELLEKQKELRDEGKDLVEELTEQLSDHIKTERKAARKAKASEEE